MQTCLNKLIVLLLTPLAAGRPSPQETTTFTPSLPFKYAFAASRIPGGAPDRYVEQEGDGEGVIKGSYAYLDPNYQWQTVSYLADKDGFHVEESPNALPQDTPAVARAKEEHDQLYQAIALRNSEVPVPIISVPNVESVAVAAKRVEFEHQYAAIAAQHARIAEEHAKLAEENAKLAEENAKLAEEREQEDDIQNDPQY